MSTKHSFNYWVLFFIGLLFILIGCNAGEAETAVSEIAKPEPTLTAPTEVVIVRDAVLDFLRDGANICVPPEGVLWHASSGGEQTPAGATHRRASNGDCD